MELYIIIAVMRHQHLHKISSRFLYIQEAPLCFIVIDELKNKIKNYFPLLCKSAKILYFKFRKVARVEPNFAFQKRTYSSGTWV